MSHTFANMYKYFNKYLTLFLHVSDLAGLLIANNFILFLFKCPET